MLERVCAEFRFGWVPDNLRQRVRKRLHTCSSVRVQHLQGISELYVLGLDSTAHRMARPTVSLVCVCVCVQAAFRGPPAMAPCMRMWPLRPGTSLGGEPEQLVGLPHRGPGSHPPLVGYILFRAVCCEAGRGFGHLCYRWALAPIWRSGLRCMSGQLFKSSLSGAVNLPTLRSRLLGGGRHRGWRHAMMGLPAELVVRGGLGGICPRSYPRCAIVEGGALMWQHLALDGFVAYMRQAVAKACLCGRTGSRRVIRL